MNSNFAFITTLVARTILQCKPNRGKRTFSSYFPVPKDNRKPDVLYLAILLEVFNLASYEIIGGRNTEIFIRMNDPSKLRRLSQQYYNNAILTNIERKRERSQKVLSSFMKNDFTNKKRWDPKW